MQRRAATRACSCVLASCHPAARSATALLACLPSRASSTWWQHVRTHTHAATHTQHYTYSMPEGVSASTNTTPSA